MRCESVGCRTNATWEVGKQSRRMKVCWDCRNFLVENRGWELKRTLFNKKREGAK